MNKRTILVAGVVFLFALSAASVFASAVNALSATPYQDDSSRDGITVDRVRVPKEIHRRVPIEIHEDDGLGSYEFENGAGGIDSCMYDIH
ncbi:MAG: hypothetical protein ACFFEU_12115 [Candidatus Thorarchaeota archaeon]